MIHDPIIQEWENSGAYISLPKFQNTTVFTKVIGDTSALPERTLLLLHGFPESSFSYHLVTEKLQARFDCIVLCDLIGYGLSDKPSQGYSYSLLRQADVALEVWKHYGIKGGHLVAHDMGNSVATELVAREVEQTLPDWFSAGFQSFTFTNGSIVLELASLRITQKLLLTSAGKYIAKLLTPKLFQHQIKSANGDAPLADIEISRLWELNLHKGGRDITHLTIKYILDRKRYETTRWLPALSKTETPIHLCWGDKDQVARVEMAYHLKEKVCPKAQLTIMENVGHFGQMGSPEKWAKSVLSFYTSNT